MLKHLWAMLVISVLMSMTGGCVSRPASLGVVMPVLALPPEVERPCDLARLEGEANLAALEVAYMRRGQQLMACDAARALAVETLKRERGLRENTRR